MTKAQLQTIADEYFAKLPYLNVPHPKRLVLLSGVVGSGKSTVARAIEQNLQAVRLSNDELRKRIAAIDPTADLKTREAAKYEVATDLLNRVSTLPNGLIVVDAGCDRGYDDYKERMVRRGYRIVLLRFEIPRAIIEQRLRQRGDRGLYQISLLDIWWRQWETFGETHTPDMTITQTTSLDDILQFVWQVTTEV